MIRALLPVNLYIVRYQLAHGRPYSRFEELLLRAISEGADEGCTFEQLRDDFQVHVRLLTEGLVTLIQEGWVAMGQNEHRMNYLLTEDGRQTLLSGRRPSNMRVRPMTATIAQERLGGGLARYSDLPLLSANMLPSGARKARRMALTPRLRRTEINGGEAERWLPRSSEQQEWIRWIDSASRASQDLHFLPIQVDLEQEEVIGLPLHWRHLSPVILAEVHERGEEVLDESFQAEVRKALSNSERFDHARNRPDTAQDEANDAPPYAKAAIACADVAITAAEARELVQEALKAATRHVLIVFGRLDSERADRARQVIAELRERSVQVDVLWSCDDHTDETIKAILRALGKARAIASPQRGAAVTPGVTFNREPSSHAVDLILSDTERGPIAVLGTAPWETSADSSSLSPALRLTEPTVLATLARLCAGWMDEQPANEGVLPSQRWRRIAEQWAARTADRAGLEPETSCLHLPTNACIGEVTLLLGPEQVVLREKLLSAPGPRFMVADGRSTVADLYGRYAEKLHSARGGVRYFAAGGSDGWILERRIADGWSPVKEGKSPRASNRHRIFADRDHWLIEYADSAHAVLSFLISDHVAVGAWARTARLNL